MEKKSVKSLIFIFVVFAAWFISSCSTRNFDNPVLKEYYKGPTINILGPSNWNSLEGPVTLNLYISDISGVKTVKVYSPETGTWDFQNLTTSTNMFIMTNIIFSYSGQKYITITAWDGVNVESHATVSVYVNITTPNVYITNTPSYFFFTNQNTYRLGGYTSIATGSVTGVKVFRQNDNTEFSASGTTYWYSDVTLLQNKTNSFRILATSDKGIVGSTIIQIVQDSIDPSLNVEYPTNGSTVPKSFDYRLNANDPLSGIYKLVYWIDNGQPYSSRYTNYYSYGGNWYNNLSNGIHYAYSTAMDNAGNVAQVKTNMFIVDGTIPVIRFDSYFGYTNLTTPWFYGSCEVDFGTTITKIEISKNDGPYLPVNTCTVGFNFVNWTNKNTTGLNNNSGNKITIRATSSAGKMNTFNYYFTIDTTPPVLNYFGPTNNTILANSGNMYISASIQDTLSPLIYAYISCKNPDAGPMYYSNDMRYMNDYDDYPGLNSGWAGYGGVFTNILIARDEAGNMIYRTNTVKVYPAVYAFLTGNDANYGFAKKPFKTIQKAVDFAKKYGINYVYIGAGTYTPGSGLNSTGNGVSIDGMNGIYISGGWEWDGMNLIQTNYSRLDGTFILNHIVYFRNVTSMEFRNFVIRNGKAAVVGDNCGGGIYMLNVNSGRITNCMLTNNSATGNAADGGGIYIENCTYNTLHFIAVKNTGNGGGAMALSGCSWNTIYGIYYKNNALYNGGAIQISGGYNNSVNAIIYNNDAARFGGEIAFFSGSYDYINFISMIAYNSSGLGGGVYISNYNGLQSYAVISNNYATNGTCKQGGGIFLSECTSIYITGTIAKNYASAGGGMAVKGGSYNSIYAIFKNNIAFSVGGGIAFTNSQRNYISSTVNNNTSVVNGGGIVFYSSIYNTIASSQIFGNITTSTLPDSGGAGISFIKSSYNYLDGSTGIYQNTATNYGGGIAILGGAGNSNFAYIYDNKAYKSGGGIAIKYGQNHYVNGQIYQNISKDNSGGGGGISVNYANGFRFEGMLFTNTSIQCGGGIAVLLCTNSSIQGVIIRNKVNNAGSANFGGGGIYMNEGLNNTIGGTISSNTVNGAQSFGGGIWIAGKNTINAMVSYNSASYGGGIYIYDNNVTVGSGSMVMYNSAQMHGAGIAVDNGPIGNNKIYGSIIGNTTVAGVSMGTGIYLSGKNNLLQAYIVNNQAMMMASAIYVANSDGTKIVNCIISNNNTDNSFVLSSNNNNLLIENNTISAYQFLASYGITEIAPVSGHIIKDNKFNSDLVQYVYYDTINAIVMDVTNLNDPAKTQASEASGNIWW